MGELRREAPPSKYFSPEGFTRLMAGEIDVEGDIPSAVLDLVKEVNLLRADVTAIRAKLLAAGADIASLYVTANAAAADIASLYTALNSHTHGGVTAGAGTTAAATAASAKTVAAVTAKTYADPAAISSKGLKKGAQS